MKKKIFYTLVSVVLAFITVVSFFWMQPKTVSNAIFTSEENIENKSDIVSALREEMTSQQLQYATVQTPFDSSTGQLMPGNSITPRTSTYGQIESFRMTTLSFNLENDDSIFMWIYLPEDPLTSFYSLEISFESQDGNYIRWHYTPMELSNFFSNSYSNSVGWKLIELSQIDATDRAYVNQGTLFFTMNIIYKYIRDDNIGEMDAGFKYIYNEDLSIYHVYKGKRINTSSGVLFNSNYVYLSFKNSFINELNSILLGDTYVIPSIKDMLEYCYVGKTDLLLISSQNNRFTWQINIKNSLMDYELRSDEKFKFETQGEHTFQIRLQEDRNDRTTSSGSKANLLINRNITLYIHDYIIGEFNNSYYNVNSKDNYLLIFTLSSDYSPSGDLKVRSTDEKILQIVSSSYDEETRRFSIVVKGKNNGRVNLIVKNEGKKPGDNVNSQYSVSAIIEVTGFDTWKSGWISSILFLIVFYVFASIVFFAITYKNIKKNRRKQNGQ